MRAQPQWEDIYARCLRQNSLSGQEDKLQTLSRELLRWNKTHNLTGYRAWPQVAVGLILDALMLAPYCSGSSCLDIGSGAGFPGLILALARPSMRVTLLEGRRKRVSFQRHIIRLLALDNVISVWGRAGEGTDPLQGQKYDAVTCKALGSLALSLNLCRAYIQKNGVILLPRGIQDEKEILALKENKPADMAVAAYYYTLPDFGGQRILVEGKILPGPPL
ncbi:MAG: 16S rRNA (guanine(527)-N(7))-methyltransferase RsmG [Desulfarculales bacterium]|nr:16S rRNA (guanine(527)-N(7))-methyltransferase RsmG [Desulfarculales bacterium]